MKQLIRDSSFWAVLVAALFYALLLGLNLPGNVLSWDVFGYYLYLPSSLIYSDLSLSNLSWLNEVISLYNNSDTLYQLVSYDDSNLIKYPTGWSILNLPFFIVGHIIALSSAYPADGFSLPYQLAITWGNWTYVAVGFVGLRKLLLSWFQSNIVAFTIILIAFGTNLLHQTIQAPGMVHSYLFALYAWFGVLANRDFHRQRPSLLLGALTGLLIITRNSEIVVFALLIVLFGLRKNRDVGFLKGVFEYWKEFKIGFGIAILPQIGYWLYVTGLPIVYSYQNPGEGFDWTNPHTIDFLFSFRKGWFIYTPIMLFAVLGIRKFRKVEPAWGLGVMWLSIFTIYLLSTWTTWWYAASFGQRSMVQSYALLALPLAAFVADVFKKRQEYAILTFVLLIGWNLFQTYQYQIGVIEGTRMTQQAYFTNLFRTQPLDQESQKLLLVNRSTNAQDNWPDELSFKKEFLQSFESDSGINREDLSYQAALKLGLTSNKWENVDSLVQYEGKRSFKTEADVPYSPAIRVPFDEITTKNHAWTEAKAFVKTESETPQTISLVVAFEHDGGAYKYRAQDFTISSREGWKELNYNYLTPEIRNRGDELTVYIWNRSNQPVWVDDVSLRIYEDELE